MRRERRGGREEEEEKMVLWWWVRWEEDGWRGTGIGKKGVGCVGERIQ